MNSKLRQPVEMLPLVSLSHTLPVFWQVLAKGGGGREQEREQQQLEQQ